MLCVLVFNSYSLLGLRLTETTAASFSDKSTFNQTQLLAFLVYFSAKKRFFVGVRIFREETKSPLKNT